MSGSLYWACARGDKQLALKSVNRDNVNYVDPGLGDTPLHQACRQGWLDIVKILIEKYGCDPNVTSKYHHESPLDYAKRHTNIDVVEYLVNKPVNHTSYSLDQGQDGKYVHHKLAELYWACVRGDKHLVLKLANPDSVSYIQPCSGDTPLHQACKQGWLDMVKLFVKKYGCDPKMMDNHYHQNPLHYACQYGHIEVVDYLINKHGLSPQLRDDIDHHDSLDYALYNNKTDVVVYICQHCISSNELFEPNRIKTTINLIKHILRANPCDPKWKTTNGDNILQLVRNSKSSISHMPSAIVLELIITGAPDSLQVHWRTVDGDNLLELVCQSKIFLSHIPSALLKKWLNDIIVVAVKKSLPDSKTADGETVIQLVCQSNICVSHVSTAVMFKWLNDTTLDLEEIIPRPEWKTADGDTLLQLVCQSTTCLSRISAAVLTEWLHATILYNVHVSLPDSKLADGDTLLQVVGQSETIVSRISSEVLSRWLTDNLGVNLGEFIRPKWKTADGDTLLQLVCQSETLLSQISTVVMFTWLESTSSGIELSKPKWKTADGDTLIQLMCQSEKCLSRISSAVLLKWFKNASLEFINISIPDSKTTDGDTLIHLVLQSTMCMLQTSSMVLSKWLSDSKEITTDLLKVVDPNWKTLDNDCFFHALCLSNIKDEKVIELIQYYTQRDYNIFDRNGNTALHIACQANKPALVSFLINEAQCDPNIKNNDGNLPLDMTTNPEVVSCLCQHTQVTVYSNTVAGWMNNRSIDDITLLHIIHLLVNNHRYKTNDDSTLLHLTCNDINGSFREKKKVIHYLLTEAHFDPNCLDSEGQMPLQLTSVLRIMKKLVKHGAKLTKDIVFKLIEHNRDLKVVELLSLSKTKGTMLWNPNDLDSYGHTALCFACKHDKPAIVNYLLSEATCDPNGMDPLTMSPLELTSNLEIAKMLIKRGAKVTTELAFQFESMESTPNKGTLIELMLTTWNPNDRDSNGYNALHLAIKADNPTMVNLLLSIAHCDPNIKSSCDEAPLQLTSNLRIMYELVEHGAKLTKDIVFKLIEHNRDLKVAEILSLSKRKRTLLWNPNDLDSYGYTALHHACKSNKPAIVNFLLTEVKCYPNPISPLITSPLEMTSSLEIAKMLIKCGAKVTTELAFQFDAMEAIPNKGTLFELMLATWNPNDRDSNGYTALHLAIKADNPIMVNLLLSIAHCDPNIKSSRDEVPLQLTSNLRIVHELVEHGAKLTKDIVFKLIEHNRDLKVAEIISLSKRKGTLLWNPNDLDRYGYTALHLACRSNKPAIVNFLLTEVKCVHNPISPLTMSPLELTPSLEIAKTLIKHGAKVTTELAFRFEAMEAIPNKGTLIQVMLTTWNPDDRDSNGYTALHLACKAENPTMVNLLLSVAHCDPNIRNDSGKVPLHLTTNPEIIKDLIRHGAKTNTMYESYQDLLGTNKPVQPPVKVFIVGNPFVGKSTLTAALKKKIGVIARMFFGKVSGVDRKTVGIVPHDLESGVFGRITLYDFAGHREFYSGHAALLQTAIQSTPPIFLLVINLCDHESEIINTIFYWISFLENQCASVSCKPHVILVGSHADILKGIQPKDKIKIITDSLDTRCFINIDLVGFVAMDCQYHESSGMNDLRHLLIKSCEELRIQEPITFNAHCFLVFLIDKFMNQTAITIKTISEKIENLQKKEGLLKFLPETIEALYRICLELNDRGHILLLKDRIAAENSYIIIDKEFLLSKISGTVFAPEDFKQHQHLSTNTGIVPLSKIAECFPDKDLGILIGFLTHLEFCHEISDHSLHQLISEKHCQVPGEAYYLFPGLISVNADDTVWQMQSNYDHSFGWILKCRRLDQFFSSRFLQVLLLRLAFTFALDTSDDNDNQNIGIHRNCYLWKNGIFWGRVFGMQTLVEVTPDNKSVLLLARFQEDDLLQCLHHRSEVIRTILQCKEQFCPRVQTIESFLGSSSPLQYPLYLNKLYSCTLQDLATAVVSDSKSCRVVLQCTTIPAKTFLSFDPYLEMKLSTIQEMWDEKIEAEVVQEKFLSTLIQQASEKLTSFVKDLVKSKSDNQLYQSTLKWRDNDVNRPKTYLDLRQAFDQYSVFAGRNILVGDSNS